MTDLDRLREQLAEKWLAKYGEQGLTRALGNLRGQVKSLSTRRQNTRTWAEALEPKLQQARRELGQNATPLAICDWLNNHKPPIHSSGGGRFIPATLSVEVAGAADKIAGDYVLECRTRMSAKALSADFKLRGDDRETLENQCIDKIVGAVRLGYILEGLSIPDAATLREIAKAKAIDIAQNQRATYYSPMLARDCFLTESEVDLIAPAFSDDGVFWTMIRDKLDNAKS